jgi:hypothetical protein
MRTLGRVSFENDGPLPFVRREWRSSTGFGCWSAWDLYGNEARLDHRILAVATLSASCQANVDIRVESADRVSQLIALAEHLAIVEERVAGRLSARIAEARADGLGPETNADPVLPTLNIGHLLDRTTRVGGVADRPGC